MGSSVMRFPPVLEGSARRQTFDTRIGWWIDVEYGQVHGGLWLYWWTVTLTLRWRQCEFCADPICNGRPCVYADGDDPE